MPQIVVPVLGNQIPSVIKQLGILKGASATADTMPNATFSFGSTMSSSSTTSMHATSVATSSGSGSSSSSSLPSTPSSYLSSPGHQAMPQMINNVVSAVPNGSTPSSPSTSPSLP